MGSTVLVAAGVLLVTLLIVLGVWQRLISRAERARVVGEIRDSRQRGTDRAVAQHPRIDTPRCIGCGSCIAACPEAGVIELVDGRAHVVHLARCIGHGRCEEVCPVAALNVGLGDISSRSDIPFLDEQLRTSVPGVFIAGELGGFALIRNAIQQGVRAVDGAALELRRRGNEARRRGDKGVLDLLIVGAGPAGIGATLRAKELGLDYLTIDQDEAGGTVRKYPRRKLTMTQPVDLPLHGRMARHEYVKEDLIALWDGIVENQRLNIRTKLKLEGVERDGSHLVAWTPAGPIAARTVVLALGRRGTPRQLGVPGESAEKVLYELLDAATYTGQHALVVGGGDSAIEAATALANQPGNVVTLSYRKAGFFRLKPRNEQRIEEYARAGRVRVFFSSQVDRIDSGSVDLLVDGSAGQRKLRIENDFVFVFAGGEPPYPLLKSIGIRFGGDEPAAETNASPRRVAVRKPERTAEV